MNYFHRFWGAASIFPRYNKNVPFLPRGHRTIIIISGRVLADLTSNVAKNRRPIECETERSVASTFWWWIWFSRENFRRFVTHWNVNCSCRGDVEFYEATEPKIKFIYLHTQKLQVINNYSVSINFIVNVIYMCDELFARQKKRKSKRRRPLWCLQDLQMQLRLLLAVCYTYYPGAPV